MHGRSAVASRERKNSVQLLYQRELLDDRICAIPSCAIYPFGKEGDCMIRNCISSTTSSVCGWGTEKKQTERPISVKGESSGSKGPLSQLLWESIVSNNDGGAVLRMAVTILAH